MSETLFADEEASRRVERLYVTPDVAAQRSEVLNELALRPGESALDIGVGPGLLAYEMAATVGSEGRLCGIDASQAMVDMTSKRCSSQEWVGFEQADACDLPYSDADFDAAVSTQVYEYVADLPRALAELERVLKPGGRALVLDTDYDSFVLHSESTELTGRILRAWDEHFVHRDLPRKLTGLLRTAGFDVTRRRVIPMFNTEYTRNCFGYGLLGAMASFAVGREGLTEDDTKAWRAELSELGRRGEFFFSINRYLFLARKAGA